ncbi:MAG: diguanylate cyclase, partial [Microcystaceae cyanobacterium]
MTPATTVIEAIALMSQSHSSCDTNQTVEQQQTNFLLNARSSCVLVVEEEQVVGILTERDVVRLSVQQQSLNGLTMGQFIGNSVVTLRETQFKDIFSAINLLQHHKIRHLPIVDQQNHLVGLVTHGTLQHIARPIDLLRLRLVREVMVREVICAKPTASMLEVAQQISLHRVSSIIIVDDLMTPLGIVTERDLVQFKALDLNLEQYRVETLMSCPVFTIQPHESLWVLQRMMQQHLIHRVVVANQQGKLLGIVTQSSILQALNPLELYKLAEVLEGKVERLEAERVVLLRNRTQELEKQVKHRTYALNRKVQAEKLLAELGTQMLALHNIPDLLQTTVEQLRQFLKCDRVNVWQFNPEWESFVVSESTDSTLSLVGRQIGDTCFKENMIEAYCQGRVRVVSDIYTTEMSDCHREMLISLQTRAKILLPLLCGQQLWGLLNVTESQYARDWMSEEIELVKAVSVQLGIAIHQATIHQRLEEELSERQKVEDRLRESNNRYVNLTNAAPVGIFLTDTAGNCLYVSDRWCEIAGMTVAEAMGEGWIKAIHPDDRDLVWVEWNQCVQQNLPFQLEYRFQRFDGKITWVYGQSVAEKDSKGRLIGYVGTITDINQRKKAELERWKMAQQLQELNKNLEQQVVIRTEKLNQMVKELEKEIVQKTNLEESLRKTTQKLEELSNTDELTQIANRRRFNQALEQEWGRAHREQLPLSLILFDVDYFKRYNDCYGHPMGDDCLSQLAQATQKVINRPTDVVARYGGEEFVILLANTDQTGAINIAKQVQQAIANLANPHQHSEVSEVVTVSMGISTIIPTDHRPSSSDILVNQADQSLYNAK